VILIRTTDVSRVTRAIQQALTEWDALADKPVEITRAAERNTDPNRCPWVGIYRTGVDYGEAPRVMGLGSGYRRQRMDFAVVVQAADPTSGEECEDRLEPLIQEVTSALLSDVSLRGTVLTIDSFAVRYENYERVGGSYFQEAVVFFSATQNTSATDV